MNLLGCLSSEYEVEKVTVPISILDEGINDIKDYFIKVREGEVEFVISKICDHAGGRLIKKGDLAICPMHGWKLNLNELHYTDSHVCKERIPFDLNEGEIVVCGSREKIFNSFKNKHDNNKVIFRWLNHATVYFEYNGVSLITDPWLFGPAFVTGWWLADPSPKDSIDLLNKADFVFISHNHPDHLHSETLAELDKEKKIIVADFQTRSTEKFLRYLGFKNIISLKFKDVWELAPGFQVCILKSGDFRDDSGIYLSINGVDFVLTVDANYLNSNVLPENIDFLFTSFAGGASGFPLCFNDYDQEEKLAIVNRNRIAMRMQVLNYIKATKPTYYVPYAGMFKEYAKRDIYINEHNLKNTIEDFETICIQNSVQLLSPSSLDLFEVSQNSLKRIKLSREMFGTEDTEAYIGKLKMDYKWNGSKVINYLQKSDYHDNLYLQLIPTDDDFNPIGEIVVADFKKSKFYLDIFSNIVRSIDDVQVSSFFIRSEVLMCIIENSLPWEDMSIGFQMRVSRHPNRYESKFWYYFTNEYIANSHFRFSSFCGACNMIDQNPVWHKV